MANDFKATDSVFPGGWGFQERGAYMGLWGQVLPRHDGVAWRNGGNERSGSPHLRGRERANGDDSSRDRPRRTAHARAPTRQTKCFPVQGNLGCRCHQRGR